MKKTKIKKDLFNRIKEIGSENKVRGITLISLIITIVILIILAGVTISLTLGNNGLFNRASQAKEEYESAQNNEQALIDGINFEEYIADSGRQNGSGSSFIEVYLDGTRISDIPAKSLGYSCINVVCDNATATFDSREWKLKIENITTVNTVCKIYFSSETIYHTVMSNINNDTALQQIFSTSTMVEQMVQNEQLMTEICNNSKLRNLLYDNASITEPLLANSEIALNAMMNSDRYEVIKKSGQNKTFYKGKAFVLGFSQNSESYGNYDVGQFLSNFTSWNPNGYNSTDGLAYRINKFASSVYINGIYGTSINWEGNMYAAIFKI